MFGIWSGFSEKGGLDTNTLVLNSVSFNRCVTGKSYLWTAAATKGLLPVADLAEAVLLLHPWSRNTAWRRPEHMRSHVQQVVSTCLVYTDYAKLGRSICASGWFARWRFREPTTTIWNWLQSAGFSTFIAIQASAERITRATWPCVIGDEINSRDINIPARGVRTVRFHAWLPSLWRPLVGLIDAVTQVSSIPGRANHRSADQ